MSAQRLTLPLLLTLALQAGVLPAQSVHAYKDANGQWVFTDRGTNDESARGHAASVPRSPEALRVAVERSDTGAATRIICLLYTSDAADE